MEIVLGALISAIAGLGSIWLGARVSRRLGIPTAADKQVIETVTALAEAQEKARENCERQLAEERGRIEHLEQVVDHLTRQNARLVIRLNALEGTNGHG